MDLQVFWCCSEFVPINKRTRLLSVSNGFILFGLLQNNEGTGLAWPWNCQSVNHPIAVYKNITMAEIHFCWTRWIKAECLYFGHILTVWFKMMCRTTKPIDSVQVLKKSPFFLHLAFFTWLSLLLFCAVKLDPLRSHPDRRPLPNLKIKLTFNSSCTNSCSFPLLNARLCRTFLEISCHLKLNSGSLFF